MGEPPRWERTRLRDELSTLVRRLDHVAARLTENDHELDPEPQPASSCSASAQRSLASRAVRDWA